MGWEAHTNYCLKVRHRCGYRPCLYVCHSGPGAYIAKEELSEYIDTLVLDSELLPYDKILEKCVIFVGCVLAEHSALAQVCEGFVGDRRW